jgi:dTDP-4-dehydrorhamnose reductase
MPNQLVVGGDGFLGQALIKALRIRGDTVFSTTRRPESVNAQCRFLDATKLPRSWASDIAYETMFICIGQGPSLCAANPEESRKVNVDATVALARQAVDRGAFVIKLSTTEVFDGSRPFRAASGLHNPVTEYGRQFSEADRLVRQLGTHSAVLRFSKAVGPELPLFRGWLDALTHNKKIWPLRDLTMAPVSCPYIVDLLCRMGLAAIPGTFNVSSDRDISFADAAKLLAHQLGVPETLVESTTMVELGIDPNARRIHATLDMSETITRFGIGPQKVEDAIAYLAKSA